MNAEVNYNIQDANALDGTIGVNEAALAAKGFPSENRTELQDKTSVLTNNENNLTAKEKKAEDLTAEQNECISGTQSLISKVRNAASSVYVGNARVLKLFNVGINKKIPRSINSLRIECEYLIPIVAERKADLLKGGLQEADITALNEAPAKLIDVDKRQENAKKERNQATIERDEADKGLKKIKTKIRKFAATAFAGNKAMLVQFEPIPKGRGGSNDDKGGTTPPPPAQ